jgi:hypothetical protein
VVSVASSSEQNNARTDKLIPVELPVSFVPKSQPENKFGSVYWWTVEGIRSMLTNLASRERRGET